ncbi:MAG: acyl-CoA thioesterase [Rubripirellula sp.]|nr:acyl-CoA thioesterase [Rubripirellula sp.]
MTFSTTRRVEFRDTDAAGIVHFSAFFPMMEAAEHELLRALGLSVMPKSVSRSGANSPGDASGLNVTWPRVSASCQYLAAAHFEDLLKIEVVVKKIGRTSVQYGFTFLRDGQTLAEGLVTSVCCRLYRGRPAQGAGQGAGQGIGGAGQDGCEGGVDASGNVDGSGNEVRLEKTPIPDEIRQLLTQYQ